MMNYPELHRTVRHGAGAEDVTRWAVAALDDVAAGRHRLSAIRHPLGFLCLPVYRRGDEGICVHLWDPRLHRARLTTSPVHCHSWDLLSYVLWGSLSNEIVEVTDDPGGATHRIFEVHSGPDGDEIRRTSRLVRPDISAARTYRDGESYRLRPGVFHQTVVPDEGRVATFVLSLGRAEGVDESLGGLDTGTHRTRREHCTAPETAYAASVAAGGLAGRPNRAG